MNEITSALRVANTAIKTVRIIDAIKKTVVVASVISCGFLAFRFIKS